MLQLLRVSIPKNGELIVDLPDDLPPLRCNSAQIRQVLMNLIINAAEALGTREGSIAIRGRQIVVGPGTFAGSQAELAAGDYVRLEIADTGRGMTDAIRARIFDPFFSTKSTGRGLGLAAVQGIVQSHGGSIEVTSSAGKGTTFQILLPRAKAPVRKKRVQRAVESEGTAPLAGTILVVEDELGLRLSVSHTLRKKGFVVLEAEDGNLAVDLLRANAGSIALALLDLTLPGKSGQEVLQVLRRTQPGAKVILTSAYGRDSFGGLMRRQPIAGFLRKPYPMETMISIVQEMLKPAESRNHHYSRGA
jgi:CheY-like chemotaxis protein